MRGKLSIDRRRRGSGPDQALVAPRSALTTMVWRTFRPTVNACIARISAGAALSSRASSSSTRSLAVSELAGRRESSLKPFLASACLVLCRRQGGTTSPAWRPPEHLGALDAAKSRQRAGHFSSAARAFVEAEIFSRRIAGAMRRFQLAPSF